MKKINLLVLLLLFLFSVTAYADNRKFSVGNTFEVSLPSKWTYVMSMDSPPHLEACPPNKAYSLQISTGHLEEVPNLDSIANDFINTFQKDNYKFSNTDKIFFNSNEYRKLVFSSVQEEKYLNVYLTYKKKTLCCITIEGKNETFSADAQTIEKIISSLKLIS